MTVSSLAIIRSADKSNNQNFLPANVDQPTAEHLLTVLSECIRRGWNDPPIRYLKARVERCYRQVLRLLAILEESGRLIIHRRRLSGTLNATNIYEIPGLEGGCDMGNVTEKLEKQIQRPNTPAPPALTPAFEILKAHYHRALEQIAHLKRWIKRGEQISQAQQWRKSRDSQAQRMYWQMRVGTPEYFEYFQRENLT